MPPGALTSVPEPTHELWLRVKEEGPQWPQPDEAGLQALAQSWRAAAADFAATGRYDTSGLNGPWADAVGGQFAARVQGTTARAAETANGMEAVAERTDGFAYEVWRLKSKIVETINANISVYEMAAAGPKGAVQTAVQAGFVSAVASRINGLIQEAVVHISASGTAWGTALDIGREIQGVGKGIADHAVETVRGMFDVPSLEELKETAQQFAEDPVGSVKAVAEGIADPIVDDWVVEDAFPALDEWKSRWEGELGREVAPALFDQEGPPDKRHVGKGTSTHFRDSDWIINQPEK